MSMLASRNSVRLHAHAFKAASCRPRVGVVYAKTVRQPKSYLNLRQSVNCRAGEGNEAAALVYDVEDIDRAKAALDLGNALCAEKRWGEALAVFEKALTLPGTGLKRYRDKPRMISDGEKQAALYNIACCHSRLNDVRTGLVSLSGCFEAGYEDFNQVRSDPDLETLRKDPRFAELLQRFEPRKPQGLFGWFK